MLLNVGSSPEELVEVVGRYVFMRVEAASGVPVRLAMDGDVANAAGWLAVTTAAGLAVAAGGTGVKVLFMGILQAANPKARMASRMRV